MKTWLHVALVGKIMMMGKNKGFNTRLKEKATGCVILHCMIHRQALASKKLAEDLGNTLSTVKARPSNKRLFAQLCKDEAHETLLLHTEVGWLSRGQVLVRFMELQEKKSRNSCKITINYCVNSWTAD